MRTLDKKPVILLNTDDAKTELPIINAAILQAGQDTDYREFGVECEKFWDELNKIDLNRLSKIRQLDLPESLKCEFLLQMAKTMAHYERVGHINWE